VFSEHLGVKVVRLSGQSVQVCVGSWVHHDMSNSPRFDRNSQAPHWDCTATPCLRLTLSAHGHLVEADWVLSGDQIRWDTSGDSGPGWS